MSREFFEKMQGAPLKEQPMTSVFHSSGTIFSTPMNTSQFLGKETDTAMPRNAINYRIYYRILHLKN